MRNESGRGAETAYAVCTALQHAEGRKDVRRYFFNFVNSLPFKVPKEEVMTLANTSRVRHRQCMHMAAQCSKETAQQWQQGTWRVIALKRLLFRQAPDEHETRSEPPFRRDSRNCWQDERLYEETIVPWGGQETKSERAANRRADERVVSLEVGRYQSSENFLFVEGTHGR